MSTTEPQSLSPPATRGPHRSGATSTPVGGVGGGVAVAGVPVGRLLISELLLIAAEGALCAAPLVLWVRALPAGTRIERAGIPLVLAVTAAMVLRLFDLLRPVRSLAAARRRQQTVAPADVAAAERALGRAPRESAALRVLLWAGLGVAVAWWGWRRGPLDPLVAAGLASMAILHAAAAGALRLLAIERILAPVRALILPHVEAIKLFAATYRLWLAAVAVAGLGLGHAALLLLGWALVGLEARPLAVLALLMWPIVVVSTVLWRASLLRRTTPIEQFFDATLRSPGTRGPSRDEPRAITAFVAAQSLPYRLAGYQAFALALAGVAAVAGARRLGVIDLGAAARLLGALALVVTAALLYQALIERRLLAPLMRHIGSRHLLPIGAIRARLGLRAKLFGCFVAVGAVGCGALALFALTPGGPTPASVVALVAGLALALGITGLVVRELVEPIQALESRSEEMARGELARPVPPSGEADEIGRLTVAFEEMRRSLRDRLRSTESINIDLEREVRRRTEALEQRNADLAEALDKLRRAQDNLVRSEKLASMGRLVAGIAHEINNPVNAVINSLGPLEELVKEIREAGDAAAADLGRSAAEMLAVVQRGATRTKAIVQALHNYSRSDESVQREVNLARSIEDSLDLLRHRLRNIEVVKEIDPQARILGLPGQVDQVLMNLLTNAAQAIGERGGTIRVNATVEGPSVVITVSDDGGGIPPDVLPHIFDPFFTTKDVGEGSGLGLSIVHGIVERHGGQITVDSQVGQGTMFRVTFPRLGQPPAAG